VLNAKPAETNEPHTTQGTKDTKIRARDRPRSGPRNDKGLANTNTWRPWGLRWRDP